MTDAIAWIRDLGMPGIAVFFALFLANTLTPLPSTHMFLAAGLLYGVWGGTLVTTVGVIVVELTLVLAARTNVRQWLERRAKRHRKLAAVDRAVSAKSKRAFLVLWLLRLSPIVPYGALNYVLAPLHIPMRRRVGALVLGMGPCNLAQAYLGSLLAGVGGLSNAGPQGTWKWVLLAVGTALAAVALVITTRATKRILDGTSRH